jgi:hypothetical protein
MDHKFIEKIEKKKKKDTDTETLTNTHETKDAFIMSSTTSPERRKTRRMPHPTTITIYNLFPHDSNTNNKQQQRGWFRRHHEYSMSLLPRDIWLDIYVNRKNNDNAKNGTIVELHRVHRTVNRSRRICPTFTHLDEAMKNTYWNKHPAPEEYESMRIRVSCGAPSLPVEPDSSLLNIHTIATLTTTTCFLEAYIHPNMLCRVDRLPTILPINCFVIAFTDGTLRMHPAQYHLLLDHLLISKPNNNNNRDDTNTNSINKGGSRFEDSTFDQLPTTSNMLDDEIFSSLQNGFVPSPNSSSSSPNTKGTDEAMGTNILWDSDSHGFEAEELTCANRTRTTTNEDQQSHFESNADKLEYNDPVHQHVDLVVDDAGAAKKHGDGENRDVGNIDLRTLARQTRSIEQRVREEEEALRRETKQLETDRELIRGLVRDIAVYDQRDAEIQRVLSSSTVEIQRLEFMIEAQRIRLIQELANIYPITHSTASTTQQQSRWFIRGLELPSDIYTGPEDVVSASLGFLCHCVHLMSKYLGIHVRYRLHCQASRSAIQDERGSVFPLFVSRTVEREQVEYALHLLDLDIICIGQARRIEMLPGKLHILAKVKRIYIHFIEGK